MWRKASLQENKCEPLSVSSVKSVFQLQRQEKGMVGSRFTLSKGIAESANCHFKFNFQLYADGSQVYRGAVRGRVQNLCPWNPCG